MQPPRDGVTIGTIRPRRKCRGITSGKPFGAGLLRWDQLCPLALGGLNPGHTEPDRLEVVLIGGVTDQEIELPILDDPVG